MNKKEYRIVKEDAHNHYEVEVREHLGFMWWTEWLVVSHPKRLDLAAATKFVESNVAEDRELRANKRRVIKIWRD